ncbi:hypothetical protein [Microcoleus vaginatus]|uniref:hypothetical protein n=1 Tax=Microcoleus vaginatus TaxID=119532 RepID=UPI0032A5A23F
MVSLNLPGGGIYDGLIAQAARKAGVDVLLTINPNDFTRLGDDVRELVQVPRLADRTLAGKRRSSLNILHHGFQYQSRRSIPLAFHYLAQKYR